MKKPFILILALFTLVSCSKESGDSSTPPGGSNNGNGTIVGNGGDGIALKFTLSALKSFNYWENKMKISWKRHSECVKQVKDSVDPMNPPNQDELNKIIFATCGNQPLPREDYFDAMTKSLKTTKLFLSDEVDCASENTCGKSFKTFKNEGKIYLSSPEWRKLSELEKIRESISAYSYFFANSSAIEISDALVAEINKRVFLVDFSIDTFRNFLDVRAIKIAHDGSEKLTQEQIVAQMSLAMDCIQLVERKFPGSLQLKAISLLSANTYEPGSNYKYNEDLKKLAYVKYVYDAVMKYENYVSTESIVHGEMELVLGENSNLQSCYNALVSKALQNPLLTKKPDLQQNQSISTPPVNGESDVAIDFINIAFKSLNYVIQDQERVQSIYLKCLQLNPNQSDCTHPTLTPLDLEKLKTIFPLLTIESTLQRLCPIDNPNCSESNMLTAVNIPAENKIFIHQSKWKSTDVATKIKVSLHEILGIAGLEANEYHISSLFAPLVYVEQFNVDYSADELREYLIQKHIFPRYVGDYYDQIHFIERAQLLMDCLNLVEQRFPNRLDIGVVSLRNSGYSDGVQIDSVDLGKALGLYVDMKRLPKEQSYLKDFGQKGLYLDASTTLQQCYNKVVAQGLK